MKKIIFILLFIPLCAKPQSKNAIALTSNLSRGLMYVPGGAGKKDHISESRWRDSIDGKQVFIHSSFYSTGNLYEKIILNEQKRNIYAIGYYPDGKKRYEDFYRGNCLECVHGPDSAFGYYPSGELHYKMILGKDIWVYFIFHKIGADGTDIALDTIQKQGDFRSIEIFYPDGSLMESDSICRNKSGMEFRMKNVRGYNPGCSQTPAGYYYRVDKEIRHVGMKYFPDGRLRSKADYFQSRFDEIKYVTDYEEWDSLGRRIWLGSTTGICDDPFSDYNEIYKRFYSNGVVEWEMSYHNARMLMEYENPEKMPLPGYFSGGTNYLIHYDEFGNVISEKK